MNGEIKKQLTKLMIETKMSWVKCLPLALLNIRTQPRTDIGISPFEMMYGMPCDIESPADYPILEDKNIKSYVVELMKRKQQLWKKGLVTQRPPLEIALHSIQQGISKDMERNLSHSSMGGTISCFTYYRDCCSDCRVGVDTRLKD